MAKSYSLTYISLIKIFQLLILIREIGNKLTFYVERHSFAYLITNLHINEYCLSLITLETALSYSLTFISLIKTFQLFILPDC